MYEKMTKNDSKIRDYHVPEDAAERLKIGKYDKFRLQSVPRRSFFGRHGYSQTALMSAGARRDPARRPTRQVLRLHEQKHRKFRTDKVDSRKTELFINLVRTF